MATPAEQTLLLGPRRSLVAVITPGSASAGSDRPVIVFLNSGIVHRVGMNRLTVSLARVLAERGSTVVRFDLSGIGDSDARPDALSPFDAAIADIREALDALAATTEGPLRVILAGLCSGADQSAYYAGLDPRVVGVILLEPSFPAPRRHYLHHYGGRLLRRESWRNVLTGKHPVWRKMQARVRALVDVAAEPAPSREDDPVGRERKVGDPEVRAFLARTYRTLADRGVPVLTILSGEMWHYREVFTDAFPEARFGAQLSLSYLADADHVFTALADQAELTRLILEWTERARFVASSR